MRTLLLFLFEEGVSLLRAAGVMLWMSLFMVGVWCLAVVAAA